MADPYEVQFENYFANPDQLIADMSNAVSINREDVQGECFGQADRYLKWATLAAIAETKYRRAKAAYLLEWERAKTRARGILHASGRTSPSKHTLEEYALQDPTYQDRENKARDYGHILDILRKVQQSLWQRRDMLQLLYYRDPEKHKMDLPNYVPPEDLSVFPEPPKPEKNFVSQGASKLEDQEAAILDVLNKKGN